MNFSPDIREHYIPLQPTIRQSAEQVSYTEFLPDISLQPFVYCYWELKTLQQLKEQFFYRIVADGCIDIFFDLHNPQESFVMGFCKKYTEFTLDTAFHYVGLRFLPTMFPQLFKVNAAELSNRFEHLQTVLPATAVFIAAHFFPGQDILQIKTLLDKYLLGIVANTKFNNDSRIYSAIHAILRHSGTLPVESGIDSGISPRQLRRLFEYYIGDTPKTFCKIVRFQHILKALPSLPLQESRQFFDAGYYDQSHFIKEFRNLYGITPGRLEAK